MLPNLNNMAVVNDILKCADKVVYKLFALFLKLFCKVDRNKVLFYSKPDYADNARALSDFLVSTYGSSLNVVWVVENPESVSAVKGCKALPCYNSLGVYRLSALYQLMTAKYVCSTHNFPLPYAKKQKEQVYVRLWHGCGYKDKTSKDGVRKVCDVAMVPGPLFVKTKAYFWNMRESDIIDLGYPRFDWLKKKNANAESFVAGLKGNATKTVIWMPTFRNDKNGLYNETANLSAFPLMADNASWHKLDEVCKANNILLLVKLHIFQKAYDIPFAEFTNIKEIKEQDYASKGLSLYEVLAETDALISDYSSVAIDYLILNRPIAFCLDDFEIYKKNRGFVFEDPLVYMPGHHLYKEEDLEKFMADVAAGNDVYAEERLKVKPLAIRESECYCETAWQKISSL